MKKYVPVAESLDLYMQSNIRKTPFNQILTNIYLVPSITAFIDLEL